MKRVAARLSLPFREPFVTAGGVRDRARELVLLRLEDEDGAVGYGEAAPFEPYDGVSVDDVVAALRGAVARGAAAGAQRRRRWRCSTSRPAARGARSASPAPRRSR